MDAQHKHSDSQTSEAILDRASLHELLGVVGRQYRIIAVGTALILMLALLILSLLKDRYTAVALIVVDESEAQMVEIDGAVTTKAASDNRVNTEVEVLKSSVVTLGAIEKLKLWNDAEFGINARSWLESLIGFKARSQNQTPASTVGQLGDVEQALLVRNVAHSIHVSQRGLTSVISIEATSLDAAKSAQLANAIAESYFEVQTASRTRSAQHAAEILRLRVNELADTIYKDNQQIDRFRVTHGIDQHRSALTQLGNAVDYYRLRRDAETNRKLYDSYVARLGEVQQTIGLTFLSSRLIAPAMTPYEPSFPPTVLVLLLAGVLGLGLGISAAILRDHFSTSSR
jgi:uncharacterized protein involved in exopolysaccharide biosynthesis